MGLAPFFTINHYIISVVDKELSKLWALVKNTEIQNYVYLWTPLFETDSRWSSCVLYGALLSFKFSKWLLGLVYIKGILYWVLAFINVFTHYQVSLLFPLIWFYSKITF